MNIFLVGFMGSGKTTVGKKLAARLGWTFIDMDAEIERMEKIPIDRIFAEKSEPYFRQLETKWLTDFDREGCVIATGGGVPCFGNNLQVMKQKGLTVYLQAPAEQLVSRLMQAKGVRPLIDHLKEDEEALSEFVRDKLAMRAPFYEQCDLVTEAVGFSASRLDDLVVRIREAQSRDGKPDPGDMRI